MKLISFCIVTFCFVFGACGVLGAVAEKPTADVTAVELSSAGFSGMSGKLHLNVYNPNAYSVPLHRVDWVLTVGSAQAVSGSVTTSETIPAKASVPVTSSLEISVSNAVQVARQMAAGVRTYSIRITLYFQTKFGELQVQVSHQGNFS